MAPPLSVFEQQQLEHDREPLLGQQHMIDGLDRGVGDEMAANGELVVGHGGDERLAGIDRRGADEGEGHVVAGAGEGDARPRLLGMAQQVFDTTLDYLKQRVQFNQVLASLQALQHRMADLFADLAQMRSAVEAGLQAVDAGFGVARAATIAKAEANRVMHTMANEGIQLHGGIGMTDEYDVGFYLKRARVLEQSFGSSSWLKDRFSKLSGY